MRKKILVAEDDLSLQEIFVLLLGKKGYEVEMIFQGNVLRDYSQLNGDLFLLDLHLSGYSGADICRQLKIQESTCRTPVIMISANPNIHILAEKAGADASIEKPFDSQQLLQLIAFHLNKNTDIAAAESA